MAILAGSIISTVRQGADFIGFGETLDHHETYLLQDSNSVKFALPSVNLTMPQLDRGTFNN
ncbi:hypothetical protein M407DRAFT_26017 [Tulasnella calospora MUT 4182]|uniref:Uncharacterized protein n=1 Tax=Tulasnella calospora MUT 4182 TaxID=1051891 RepID=A0A0C3LT76_9AGAM|nr:hypothetical protein M407DRAFT_26017 [Tulasnella calospora MUT 4182]